MAPSWAIIKEALTQDQLNRLACLYLHTNNGSTPVNWDAASADYGASNAKSMRQQVLVITKKISGLEGGAEGDSGTAGGETVSSPTVKKPRKRKDPNAEDDDENATKKKTKAGTKAGNAKGAKAAAETVRKSVKAEKVEDDVKAEPEEEA